MEESNRFQGCRVIFGQNWVVEVAKGIILVGMFLMEVVGAAIMRLILSTKLRLCLVLFWSAKYVWFVLEIVGVISSMDI